MADRTDRDILLEASEEIKKQASLIEGCMDRSDLELIVRDIEAAIGTIRAL